AGALAAAHRRGRRRPAQRRRRLVRHVRARHVTERTVRRRRASRGVRGARGFTLLEVMVALAVIATAFTALLGLHVRSLRVAARDQSYTQALLLSRSLITEAELGPYPEVGIAQGDFEDRWPGLYGGYRWERTVSDFGVL